jgi:single-strand DNA-binding protein
MANFNKVLLVGNLTKDPELRYTPQGTAVVNLRLATNRRFKDRNGEQKEEACFVTVVVWNKQAETCNQYLRKGRSVLIEGRLQSRSWEDSSGQKRNVLEVRAERVQFLGAPSQQAKISEELKTPVSAPEEVSSGASWLEESEGMNNET